MAGLWVKKSFEQLQQEAQESEHSLRRALGPVALVSLGIGAIVGAGIFVLSGIAAQHTGPALVLSVILSGIGCAFAGLCYAEFASMIPVAGSAYTYSYASVGEFLAWIIGWDLILEYAVGATTVSIGWSGYLISFLQKTLHLPFPAKLTASPWETVKLADWENVGWGNPLRDFTSLWVRSFVHPAWQENFLEGFRKGLKIGSADFEVLFGVEKILQNFGNLTHFDQAVLPEELALKESAMEFFRWCVLETIG